MYTIKMICHDAQFDVKPYEDTPNIKCNEFKTKAEALEIAFDLAEEDADYLNDDCEKGVSFNVVETPNGCNVMYYYVEDEFDDTGNTEIVTEYIVIKK